MTLRGRILIDFFYRQFKTLFFCYMICIKNNLKNRYKQIKKIDFKVYTKVIDTFNVIPVHIH